MNNITTAISALQQAGVSQTEFRSSHLLLREMPDIRVLRIRGMQPEATVEALRSQGIEASSSTGGSHGPDPSVLCLRPGEWLVCSAPDANDELLQRVQAALAREDLAGTCAVMDMSDGLAVFQLSGAAAPWLLAKLGGFDFLGNRHSGRYCARMRLGQIAVVVNCQASPARPDEFVYDLILDRSVARYLWELLLHSAPHAEELSTGS